jgi:predicted DNA-binding protein YlxM (UPF0122 family)
VALHIYIDVHANFNPFSFIAIKLHDGGKSSRDVAQIMGIGRTQIQQIIKRKSEVLDDYESNVSNDQKRDVLTPEYLRLTISRDIAIMK